MNKKFAECRKKLLVFFTIIENSSDPQDLKTFRKKSHSAEKRKKRNLRGLFIIQFIAENKITDEKTLSRHEEILEKNLTMPKKQ